MSAGELWPLAPGWPDTTPVEMSTASSTIFACFISSAPRFDLLGPPIDSRFNERRGHNRPPVPNLKTCVVDTWHCGPPPKLLHCPATLLHSTLHVNWSPRR